jgi:PPIC-type PPIASE domain
MKTRFKGISAVGLLGAGALGFGLGRVPPSPSFAGPPAPPPPAQAPAAPAPSDYSQRVVAYIYGSVPVTREDLGEYLIARQGVEKVELLVNKKIIEHACEKAGVVVTEAEVEVALEEDLKGINVNRKQFVETVLKQYGKTLYEWKEDTIRPKLMMNKLCKERVEKSITDEDLKKAFDANYGEKVECRIIIWPKGEERIAMQEYDAVRKSEEGFDRKARAQAISSLAMSGGKIKPIAHSCGVHPEVEQQAYALQPGEVSRLIVTPEGTVVLKVDKKLPPDAKVKMDEVKDALRREVYEKKLAQEIPTMFKAMREEAKPVFILKRSTTAEDLERDVRQELHQTGATAPAKK